MNASLTIPLPFVLAVIVFVLLENVPEAPEDEAAVNVTEAPGIGLPKASATVTERGIANDVFTVVTCGVVPEVAAMEAGAPG